MEKRRKDKREDERKTHRDLSGPGLVALREAGGMDGNVGSECTSREQQLYSWHDEQELRFARANVDCYSFNNRATDSEAQGLGWAAGWGAAGAGEVSLDSATLLVSASQVGDPSLARSGAGLERFGAGEGGALAGSSLGASRSVQAQLVPIGVSSMRPVSAAQLKILAIRGRVASRCGDEP